MGRESEGIGVVGVGCDGLRRWRAVLVAAF